VPEVIEYPSEVEISDENLQEIRSRQHIISMEIARLGLLQQNYESDKELLLELIEENQKSLQTFLQSLQESYNLDVKATYVLNLPPDGKQKASFIKRESN
jgi:cysteinyl-tRNA synthetase